MRNAIFAPPLLLLALMGISPAAAWAQAPNGGPELASNAALKYWTAFALLPTPDKGQEALLEKWSTAPLDASAQALIDASDKSRLYLHRGAKLPRCDWALDYDDGMGLLLPYLVRARDLARLTALHARREFEQGHREAGADDAIVLMALARHVGSDPIMIGILVRHLIESTAIDLLALHLPDLRDSFPKVLSAYQGLPAGATFSEAYRTQKTYTLRWLIARTREAEAAKPGSWRALWDGVLVDPESLEVVKRIETAERAITLAEDLIPVCDELAQLVDLPRGEFEARYPEFKTKVKAANPLAGVLLGAPDRLLVTAHRNVARMAMLEAAMAVVRGGPDALKGIKDPFGDGPFAYRALKYGFELKSKLLYHDQPVTLTVGPGAKG